MRARPRLRVFNAGDWKIRSSDRVNQTLYSVHAANMSAMTAEDREEARQSSASAAEPQEVSVIAGKRVAFAADAKTTDGGERPISRRRRERLRQRALEEEAEERDAIDAICSGLVSRIFSPFHQNDTATHRYNLLLTLAMPPKLPAAWHLVLLFDAMAARAPPRQNVEEVQKLKQMIIISTGEDTEEAAINYLIHNRHSKNAREKKTLQALADSLEKLLQEVSLPIVWYRWNFD